MLPRGLLKEYSGLFSLAMRLLDMSMIALAGWVTYSFKFNTFDVAPTYLIAMGVGALFTPIVFSTFNIYSSVRGKGFWGHIGDLFRAMISFAMLLAGFAFITKTGEQYSREWFGFWVIASFLLSVVMRCGVILMLHFMRSHGLNERRVVILGAGSLGTRFAMTVQQALWTGFRIVAFLDDEAEGKAQSIHGIPVKQTPSALSDYLTEERVDEFWIALPLSAESRVKDILFELRHHTITTRFVLDIFELDLLNHSITDIAGFPVLNVRTSPMHGANRLVKGVEDRLLAFGILLLISPLLVLIALGVKLTSNGPVLFKQRRLGQDGKVINVYKFRTMYLHAEAEGQVTQATSDDKRITPLGKFLRRTSLDELPQFFNVLQGRMSIVGPRPHALAHNEQYKELVQAYMQRHNVKPGITGWAQVNGWRGETDTLAKMQKRVEYDLYYINNWSLWFDLKIIFLTLFRGFLGKNAY